MSVFLQPLQTVTVGSGGATTITFSSIPQTYTDLIIKFSTRSTWGQVFGGEGFSINGGSTAITGMRVLGNGSSASSAATFTIDGAGANATANTFGSGEIYIPNYTSSNYKSILAEVVGENNNSTALQQLLAGLWSSTSPITSITFTAQSGQSETQYSTFYLYGVLRQGI
jgi:hypothetical protein